MVGYEMKDLLTATISYSVVDENGAAAFNTATVGGYAAQSKLYTEAWWNYGFVTQAGAKTVHASVEGDVADITLAGYYTNVDQSVAKGNNDFEEFTATASKSYGQVDVTLAYINATVGANDGATKDNSNTLQLYLTANF
jgi:fructose-specific phosphotransferase system IIC component